MILIIPNCYIFNLLIISLRLLVLTFFKNRINEGTDVDVVEMIILSRPSSFSSSYCNFQQRCGTFDSILLFSPKCNPLRTLWHRFQQQRFSFVFHCCIYNNSLWIIPLDLGYDSDADDVFLAIIYLFLRPSSPILSILRLS